MTRITIAALIPHAGAMCLLDSVTEWSEQAILCRAVSHLDPGNPLRRAGVLSMVCGVEYALQAAALHGALRGGMPQPAGFLASLRLSFLHGGRLDDAALGCLAVSARCEHGDASGLIYEVRVASERGERLIEARAAIALPPRP